MQIEQSAANGVTVIRIRGRLDAASSAEFETTLLAAAGPGADCLALDLSGVEFVSSGGLRVFLQLAKELRTRKGKAAIFGAVKSVAGVFRISGLAQIVPIYATEAEAIAAISG